MVSRRLLTCVSVGSMFLGAAAAALPLTPTEPAEPTTSTVPVNTCASWASQFFPDPYGLTYDKVGPVSDATRDYTAYRPVFPGAEGFGTSTPAGVGPNPCKYVPRIVKVTNTSSDPAVQGSLPWALTDYSLEMKTDPNLTSPHPRFVVFEVAGTIDLGRNNVPQVLSLTQPYVTVAGQTAPIPGVTLKNGMIVTYTHDVLIQHIKVRPGDQLCQTAPIPGICKNLNAVTVGHLDGRPVYNVVVDHVSASWTMDETFGLGNYGTPGRVSDVTYSNSISSEGLFMNTIGSGSHGLLQDRDIMRVAIVRNLFVHQWIRTPLVSGNSSAVVVNNLTYDYGLSGPEFRELKYVDPKTNVSYYAPYLAALQSNVTLEGWSGQAIFQGQNDPNDPVDCGEPAKILLSGGITGTRALVDDNLWLGRKSKMGNCGEAQYVEPVYGQPGALIYGDGENHARVTRDVIYSDTVVVRGLKDCAQGCTSSQVCATYDSRNDSIGGELYMKSCVEKDLLVTTAKAPVSFQPLTIDPVWGDQEALHPTVLECSGAFPMARYAYVTNPAIDDYVDARIEDEVRTLGGSMLYGSNHASDASKPPSYLGMDKTRLWPTYTATRKLATAAKQVGYTLPVDSDTQSDPNDVSYANSTMWLDSDGDGYTQFEEILHALAASIECEPGSSRY